jgi:hypothetical protein
MFTPPEENGKLYMKSQNFMHVFDMPRDAQSKLENIFE